MSTTYQEAASEKHAENKLTATYVPPWKRVGVYVVIALGCFLLGAVPMWFKAHQNGNQRDAAQRELRLSQMQNTLSAAVIYARRGEYEPARQSASDFFTTLRQQLNAGDESSLTKPQRDGLAPLLVKRDDVITLVARGDAASADRLSDMYVAYQKAMSNVQPQS